jgi:molybdopterin-binding protein
LFAAGAEPAAAATSIRNRLRGTVVAVEPFEVHKRVVLDCGGVPLVSFISAAAASELSLVLGATVVALFKAATVHLL